MRTTIKIEPQIRDKYNVCLITIDSCRYDTAKSAATPTLDSLSKLKEAESHATYTYPTHHSLFIGILPRLIGERASYIEGYDQIWRSSGVRESDKKVFQTFHEPTIIKHYEDKGYNVQGCGGVNFFNPRLYCNSLCMLFTNFTYFGSEKFGDEYKTLPRKQFLMPLGNVDKITKSLEGTKPFFLFINCPETHIPYDTDEIIINDKYVSLIKRLQHEHATKIHYNNGGGPFTKNEIDILHKAQIKALEYVDKKLKVLFSKLPNLYPTLFIILGDHGEEFGEEGRFGHAHSSQYVTKVPVWSGWVRRI